MKPAALLATFTAAALVLFGAATIWRDSSRLPTFDEEMATIAAPGALDCGVGAVKLVNPNGGTRGQGCAGAYTGGEIVDACTVRAWKTKRPFKARFHLVGESRTLYGLAGNSRGDVFFMSDYYAGIRRCESPEVHRSGQSQIVGCGEGGSECQLIAFGR